MRILFLGDVMGKPGRAAVREHLGLLVQKHEVDFCLANAENASGGVGLTSRSARDMFQSGLHVLTSGNHIWRHKEIRTYMDEEPRLLRPANYPEDVMNGAPGTGLGVFESPTGVPVAVLNLMGRTYMEPVDCPFRKADALLAELPADVKVRVVDVHAEATSEKIALAWYLSGRVSAVLGTHTHVQTNDPRVLHSGTAAITDLGMCGVAESVLGMDVDIILDRFVTRMPSRFELAKGTAGVQGALVDVSPETGRAVSMETLNYDCNALQQLKEDMEA